MPCYAIDNVIPVVHPNAFVHPTAVLIGDVILEEGVYIGPFASLRADFGQIHVCKNSNVQDNCVIHGFPKSITLIEEYGHIGHAAILHGCTIGKNVLVGMNSVILDEAEIGENTIIGSPAKVVRDLLEQEIEWKRNGTNEYIHLTQRCINSLREVEPLISLENRLDFTNFKAEHKLY
jgi:phenylacetic acid degradation protein